MAPRFRESFTRITSGMVRFTIDVHKRNIVVATLIVVAFLQFLFSSSWTTKEGNEVVVSRVTKISRGANTTASNDTSLSWMSDEACLASNSIPLTSQLWTEQLPAIREALLQSSAVPLLTDLHSKDGALLDDVLAFLPPSRLRRSIRPASANPEQHALQIRRVLRVLKERKEYPDTAPKLQVLVFGGSVTAGVLCSTSDMSQTGEQCAWPKRLELFLNRYLGFDAVEIVSLAVRGTRSNLATMMLNYGLLPESMRENGPDIIINGYSVNDFQLHSETTKIPYGGGFQHFVDSVNRYASCERDRPLLMQLDDKVVNSEAVKVYFSESFNFELAMFAQWSGVWSVSYSDVVRDLAYRGGREETLLLNVQRDPVHPPWTGHVGYVATIFFNIMHSALEYCHDLKTLHDLNQGIATYGQSVEHAAAYLDPRHRPPLMSGLTTQRTQKLWREESERWVCSKEDVQPTPCLFSWVGSQNVQETLKLPDISSVLETSQGWSFLLKELERNSGLQAEEMNATAVLRVNVDSKDANPNVLSLFYMKSYSGKWLGTLMKATIYVDSLDSTPVGTFQLSGYHESPTSEYFPYTHRFNASSPSAIFIRLEMIGGAAFKIVGLAVCTDGPDH